MKCIDMHHHFYLGKYTIDQMVEISKQCGTEKMVLCAAGERFGYAGDSWTLKAMEKYPDYIIGWGFFDLGINKPSYVDELVAKGFKGVKFIKPLKDYSDKEFYPVYERLQYYKLPSLFHTGGVNPTETDRDQDVSCERMKPMMLDTIARAFPDTTFIGAHLGVPWYNEACMAIKQCENLYFDLSGAINLLYNKSQTFFETLTYLDRAKDRFLYGSDCYVDEIPETQKKYENMFNTLDFPQELRDKIMYKNAAKILGLDY